MRVEPQRERVVRGALDEAGGLARGQALLGLAAELRLGHLQREHERDPVPDVLGRQLHPARQQVAEVAEFPQRVGAAGAQAVDVGAVLRGRDQVDVALLHQVAVGHPGDRPVDDLGLLLQRAGEQVGRQQLGLREPALLQFARQVGAQALVVAPLVALAAGLVVQAHGQPGAQHRLRAQQVAQRAQVELRAVEVLRVGPEAQPGTGVALAHAAHDVQGAGALAVGEGHVVLVALALDPHLQPLRQRVDHADADAVQAAGEGVVAVVELAAGVQAAEDQLDAGHAFLRVHVHRHAAAVVGDLAGAVGVQHHLDLAGVAGQGLVHRVVHHLLGKVVGARGVGVHPRPAPDRIEPGKDLDVCCVVTAAHPPIVA